MTEAIVNSEQVQTQGTADWYKDAVIYELHVRAFFDSNGDGTGDFGGLTAKLDYLKDLGVTALWLLPFYPSPGLDDGYDIADYTDVNPSYGTMRDVRVLIREAHKRGLKVITELVCNHTSDQHAWFQRARRSAPGSPHRDFYVWSDSPEKYKGTRIIFKDFEASNWSWDDQANAYYWHRFYRHQPDLNFDNPRVREAIMRVMDFWLEMGVDGLRLDAVPYLYEREGTSCENLPETFGFLRELRAHIDANFEDRMLLAEANQWPEDAVAYFGDGDLCQMAFHFPLMPRLFMSIHMEDRYPIVDIVRQTPALPDNCQWAIFLRNHDELTLEMVTDEERDYMNRVYAVDHSMRINLGIRRRLAPLLGNHRRRIELMNGLLFAMPGTPVIYYGDEIGMGDNVYLGDRNGVRTPMQWSGDRNAGFSRANPQKLFLPVVIDPEYNYETVNVEAQAENQHSLLWWTRRLISLRKRYRAFGRGTMEFLQPDNRKILAFIRRFEDERILVIANLSRFVQGVSLDLSEFAGMSVIEMFGRVEMPGINEGPYFLTLGPHSFYWFSIEPQRVSMSLPAWSNESGEAPLVTVRRGWRELFEGAAPGPETLAAHLPGFLSTRRWFAGKGRRIRFAAIEESIPVRTSGANAFINLVTVQYTEGAAETYVLPLAYETGDAAYQRQSQTPEAVFLRTRIGASGEEGILFDAMHDEAFAEAMLRTLQRTTKIKARDGEIAGVRTSALRRLAPSGAAQGKYPACGAEQHVDRIRRQAAAEAVSPRRAGYQSGPRDRPVPDRDRLQVRAPGCGRHRVPSRAQGAHQPWHHARVHHEGERRLGVHTGLPARLLRPCCLVQRRGRRATDQRIEPVAPDRGGVAGARWGDDRCLRGVRPAPGGAHSPDASGARRGHAGVRLRAGELHALLPALPLSIDAQHVDHGVCPAKPARQVGGGCATGGGCRGGDGGRNPSALPRHREQEPVVLTRTYPRRLPPRPGALHGLRLHHHGLRGRTGEVAKRAPSASLSSARRRRHAALIQLRRTHGAARARPARPAGGVRGPHGHVGPVLAGVGQQRIPRLISARGLEGQLPPGEPGGAGAASGRLHPGEGRLRDGLRAQQPPGLAVRAPAGNPRANAGPGVSNGELERLARAYDIQLSYKDLQENEIHARPQSLVAALCGMGVIESAADVSDALKHFEVTAWRWSIPPVVVTWEGKRGHVSLRLPEAAALGTGSLKVELESGAELVRDLVLAKAKVTDRATVGGERFVELDVALPSGLPYGYHRLCIDVGGQRMQAQVISAPRRVYASPEGPSWGVFMPLYALHSKRSWGIGDYTDLKRLIEWSGSRGAGLVATLPLLPAFLDEPFAPSPYEPVSRLFWNEVFVDPEAPLDGDMPSVDAGVATEARSLVDTPDVDYAAVMRLKRQVLETQAAGLADDSEAGREMQAYLASRPEVRDYAAFRAAVEKLGPDWRAWRQKQRDGELGPHDYDPATARYYEYAQWRAHTQMRIVADTATSLGMRSYLDLPVGVHEQGYDAWRYRDVFAQGMTVGAPPDLYATNGQNWGFQPLNPHALRKSGYEYVARYLRHYFASAKMLRIDHAIGLHRLYWIPEGATGHDGVFVRQPAEELYAVLCLESTRYEAVVIAENLGLVPPEVDRGLKAHGISGMYVQIFEMTGRKNQPLRRPRADAVASFSTHDLPTFAGYWQDDDLKQREALGLLTPERVAEEQKDRSRDRKALVGRLKERGLVQEETETGQLFRGSTALLAESDAHWVLLNLEDTWGETRPQNLPGTNTEEHPNWVARSAYSLDEFDSVPELTKAIETVKLYRPVDNKAAIRNKEGV